MTTPDEMGLDKPADTSTMTPVEEKAIPQGGLSVREAAAMLGVVEATIYLLAKKGTITLLESPHGKIVPLDVLDTLRKRWRR